MALATKKIALALAAAPLPDEFKPTVLTARLVVDDAGKKKIDVTLRGSCTKGGEAAGDRDFTVRVTPASTNGQKVVALVNAMLTAAAGDDELKGSVAAQ